MSDDARIPTPLGVPGLAHYSGFVSEEWDRRLRAQRGIRAYKEMADGDSSVGSLLYAIISMARQTGYRIEPPDDSPAAAEVQTYVESCFEDMQGTFGDTLAENLSCLTYGYSLAVPVYKARRGPFGKQPSAFDDGRIGWDRWSPRAQEAVDHWIFDDEGTATAFVHRAPPLYQSVTIPLDRCLHFVIRQRKGSPEGLSLLRNAFEAYTRKRGLQRLEAISLERGGAGFPEFGIPSELMVEGNAIFESYKKMATSIRIDEQSGLVRPSDVDPDTKMPLYTFEFKSPTGTAQINFEPTVARADREIFRTVLADFITQGDTGVGSYAQSVNRTDLFLGAVNGLLDSHADVITRAIRMLLVVSEIDLKLAPKFVFNDVRRPDMASVAATVIGLVNAGLVNPDDPGVQERMYDIANLPMPTDMTAIDKPNRVPPGQQDQQANAARDRWQRAARRTAAHARRTVEPDDIDAAMEAFNRWVPKNRRDMLDAEHAGKSG